MRLFPAEVPYCERWVAVLADHKAGGVCPWARGLLWNRQNQTWFYKDVGPSSTRWSTSMLTLKKIQCCSKYTKIYVAFFSQLISKLEQWFYAKKIHIQSNLHVCFEYRSWNSLNLKISLKFFTTERKRKWMCFVYTMNIQMYVTRMFYFLWSKSKVFDKKKTPESQKYLHKAIGRCLLCGTGVRRRDLAASPLCRQCPSRILQAKAVSLHLNQWGKSINAVIHKNMCVIIHNLALWQQTN